MTHFEGSKIKSQSPSAPEASPTTVLLWPSCCKYKGCLFDIRTGLPFDSMRVSSALTAAPFTPETGLFLGLGEVDSEEGAEKYSRIHFCMTERRSRFKLDGTIYIREILTTRFEWVELSLRFWPEVNAFGKSAIFTL